MKQSTFFSPCLYLIVLFYLISCIHGAPVVSKRQNQASTPSLLIQAPTKNDNWVIGSTKAITWTSTSNSPIDILLSKEGSSDVIMLAQGLNSFQQSYVLTVPTSIETSDSKDGSKWKIIIKDNRQIFSNSDYFAIYQHAPSTSIEQVSPPSQAVSENHWAATASISLLGPDGKVLSLPQTATSSATRDSFIPLWTLFISAIATCLFVSL